MPEIFKYEIGQLSSSEIGYFSSHEIVRPETDWSAIQTNKIDWQSSYEVRSLSAPTDKTKEHGNVQLLLGVNLAPEEHDVGGVADGAQQGPQRSTWQPAFLWSQTEIINGQIRGIMTESSRLFGLIAGMTPTVLIQWKIC
jgi:hypothetical protein